MSADTTNLLLDSYLKTLKLPAVARAYPALSREAADKNLGYAEFLKALCSPSGGWSAWYGMGRHPTKPG